MSKFILAPMAEITNHALRFAVQSFSPNALLYSEMLSSYHIVHGGIKNRYMVMRNENERTVFQLLGNDPVCMADAALRLEALGCEGIDINMGCSAPDILKMRCGGYLLKEPETALSLVRSVRESVKCRVSVKIRAGFESVDEQFTIGFCKKIESEGADWIIVHPRAAKQAFRGSADWKIVSAVKAECGIPIVGNGDIVSAEKGISRLRETGCDSVMIGRAAVQKPWLIGECESVLNGCKSNREVNLSDIARSVLEMIDHDLPPELHQSRAHRFLVYFTKNFVFGHPLMSAIRKESSIEKMILLVEEYCGRNEHERAVKI